MSWQTDPSSEPDESFGPGTDLVISLFAVLLLLLVLAIRALNVSIVKTPPPEPSPKNLWELREDYREQPLFKKDEAVLTSHAREQLLRELPAIRQAIESDSCNQLLVEGYASPEAPVELSRQERERWNLNLSADRSMAVIDYLYVHGIPYECMGLAGFGRSHSGVLAGWLKKNPEQTLTDWDDVWSEPSNEIDESVLAQERVVRILGIYHSSSLCNLAK